MDSGGLLHGASSGSKNGDKSHLSCSPTKNLGEFCQSPENLSQVEFNTKGPRCLVKEIIRLDRIQAVSRLLLTALIQVCQSRRATSEQRWKLCTLVGKRVKMTV